MPIDMPTLHRIMVDVACGHAPGDDYTDEMRVIYDRSKSDLALARKKNPKLFLHIPGDGVEGMPDGPGGGGRTDYSDDQPGDESGKWTSGGGGAAAPKLGGAGYDHSAEAAKAERGMDLGAKEYRKFLDQQRVQPLSGGMGNYQYGVRQERIANNEEDVKYRQEHPSQFVQAGTLEGQARLPGSAFKTPDEIAEEQRQVAVVDRIMGGPERYREADLGYEANNGNKLAQEKLNGIVAERQKAIDEFAAKFPEKYGPEVEKKFIADFVEMGKRRGADADEAKEAFDRLKLGDYKEAKANEVRVQRALKEREAAVAAGRIPLDPLPGERTAFQKAQQAAEEANMPGGSHEERAGDILRQEEKLADKEANGSKPPNRWNQNQESMALANDPQNAVARGVHEVELDEQKNAIAKAVREHEGTTEAGRIVGGDRIYAMKRAAEKEADNRAKAIAMAIPMRAATPDGIADMEKREIVSTKPFNANNTSDSYRATLDDGSFAMWKPAEGEEHGLRENIEGGTYYLREAAAAKVAPLFGVSDILPATVVGHDKDGNEGTLQSWAVHATPLVSYGESFEFDREKSEKMRVFDYVTGNSDRHNGNVMVAEQDGKHIPIMIDNGLTFPNGHPDRFIQPYDYLPRENGLLPQTHETIKGLDLDKMAKTLHESGIEDEAIHAAVARGMRLKKEPNILALDHTIDDAYAWDSVAKASHSTSLKASASNVVRRNK